MDIRRSISRMKRKRRSPMWICFHSFHVSPGRPWGCAAERTGLGPRPSFCLAAVYVSQGGPPPMETSCPDLARCFHHWSALCVARSACCRCMHRSTDSTKSWVACSRLCCSTIWWMSRSRRKPEKKCATTSARMCNRAASLAKPPITPLKNISQLELLFPIYGKIENVPNHQPDQVLSLWPKRHVMWSSKWSTHLTSTRQH